LVADIRGRREDVLSLPARQGGLVSIHPNVFHRILEPIPATGWQVIQELDRLRVLLAGAGEQVNSDALEGGVKRELESQGAVAPIIQIERVVAIPRTPLGKAPLIQANHPTQIMRSARPLQA
jgi:phenylacetate-coenzyme A ligase PaaK-like adenylate-forming protein